MIPINCVFPIQKHFHFTVRQVESHVEQKHVEKYSPQNKLRRCVSWVHFTKIHFGKYTSTKFLAELDHSQKIYFFSGPNVPYFWWLPNIEQSEAEHPSRMYQFRSPRSRRTVLNLPKHDCRLSIGWDSGQERHLISGSQFVGLIKGSCDQCGSMWSDQHNEPVCDLHNRIITHLSPTCPGADTNSIVKTVATSWGWGWNYGVPELQDVF